jgi:hypothetical protein
MQHFHSISFVGRFDQKRWKKILCADRVCNAPSIALESISLE